MHRILSFFITLLMLVAAGEPAAAAVRAAAVRPVPLIEHYREQVESPPQIWAHGAVLMDAATGDVLWEHNAHKRLHPASTTKVLTGLIALERGDLNAKVKISRRAATTPGSSMYLREGEVHSLHDLVYGLLLRSGNDAAVAIAEAIAGSVEDFAVLMNERAQRLGAKNSHFVNPHGLTHPDHLSTAYDLAVITRAALQNPLFAEIVATPVKELTYEELGRTVVLYNTNRLLTWLEGADGVKTGTTGAAGACLVSSVTRDEQKLIAVVLNASNRWRESAALLEWGFRNFRLARLGRAGEVLVHLPVRGGKRRAVPVAFERDLAVVLPRTAAEAPPMEVDLAIPLRAPVRAGQQLGRVRVETPGSSASERQVELVAAREVPAATWLDHVYELLVSLVGVGDILELNLITGYRERVDRSDAPG
ncbi:D-alanyl-D-alanine carboxypeptidase (penicillin-binding protein 5/6) [Symbiobacterium terraclitae]|uniref:serine-type D-Ala-D-Ala carboxypeptidase n=1 Tax=Symbiobacterium terraclitae TaxID=557451 RepID=A0ABS4JPW8_9FIRM|nr:D-alanyl-D-alanine carboxypeptidase (penicillin-binding protein 5/6) [Symbiobacterium terraclitae]